MLLIEDRTDIVDAAEADGVVISQRGAPLRAGRLLNAVLHRCLNRSYCTYSRRDGGCSECWSTVLLGGFLPPWRRNKPLLVYDPCAGPCAGSQMLVGASYGAKLLMC